MYIFFLVSNVFILFFFFFSSRRRHTRLTCDWSSDVCSSDLNTQSFPVVCDSPSPGTSWRNRENPAPLRAHVSATIGTETVATLVKVPRKEYCFRQNDFIGEIHCSPPKLVNGSEKRCSFIFDKKYDELRWFRLTRVTAYGMNVFR